METILGDINRLDDDCWGMIFERLKDYKYDFASASLACKRFLLITNRVKVSLIVSDLTVPVLPSLLRRFQCLKNIEFRIKSIQNPDRLITHILESDIQQLEALTAHNYEGFSKDSFEYLGDVFGKLGAQMKGLKRLDLSHFYRFCDDSLILLSTSFRCLEELGIKINFRSHITDDGIEVLASNLRGLKKITLSDFEGITDKSIRSLSSNCVDLMDVSLDDCRKLTESGIGFMMRHSSKLSSLFVSSESYLFWQEGSEFTIANSISHAKNLEHLTCSGALCISNDVLKAIAQASPPLKSFRYQFDEDPDSMPATTMLLQLCPSLEKLSMQNRPWNSSADSIVLKISQCLHGLTHLYLSIFKCVDRAVVFTLIKSCPLLELIDLSDTFISASKEIDGDSHQNYRMKHLNLGHSRIENQTLVSFGLLCPNLEFINIDSCKHITNEGVANLLKVCPKLKHLDLTRTEVSSIGEEETKLKLTSINARRTRIDDKAIEVIGTRCPDLEELSIRECHGVTNAGVKALMSKCVNLREINLWRCKNVSVALLKSINMWNLKPSLKKIRAYFKLTEEKRDRLFSSTGCMFLNEE